MAGAYLLITGLQMYNVRASDDLERGSDVAQLLVREQACEVLADATQVGPGGGAYPGAASIGQGRVHDAVIDRSSPPSPNLRTCGLDQRVCVQ